MRLSLPPLALYVHLPWCVRKCPYCDFNSYTLRGELPEAAYVQALGHDLAVQARWAEGREIVSVFFGGGTPSLFSPRAIERVLTHARTHLPFAADVEVTLEANPGTLERGRFAAYRAAGVNRVSLGAQSFSPQRLAALGRIHSPADTCRAAEELHACGLANFNLDLMYALPGQDLAAARADVASALALSPAHLSHYQLTIEPGTVFAGTPPAGLPDEETAADMFAACAADLAAGGFERYETSAWARAGRRSRHNLNYWRFGDYLGIGAGAHGKLTDAASGRVLRTVRAREPRRYLAAAASPPTAQAVAPRELPFEFMLNALRLAEGFTPELFQERTGLSWQEVAPTLERLRSRGLTECSGGAWRASAHGERFLNELLLVFIPAPATGGPGVSTAHGANGEAHAQGSYAQRC